MEGSWGGEQGVWLEVFGGGHGAAVLPGSPRVGGVEHGARAPAGEVPALQAAGEGAACAAEAAAPQTPREGEVGTTGDGPPALGAPDPSPGSSSCPSQETERMNRFHQLLLEDLRSQQAQERAQLLKSQRCDAKTRLALFKDNLKIQEANGAKQRERAKQVQGGQ